MAERGALALGLAAALVGAVCLGVLWAPLTRASALARPRCFGAASIAPGHPCRNPALDTMVVPAPALARTLPNAPCTSVAMEGAILVCGFGYQGPYPIATVALIGDSHAATWRAALQVLAQRERWRGISLTQTSCPLSAKTPAIEQPARANCERWKRQLPGWLAAHPEIRTAFVVAHTGGAVLEREGLSVFEAQVQGYLQAWRKLVPASIRHIVVIRDNPGTRSDVIACVERAISRHEDAGVACEVPRESALAPDPEVEAARELHSPRVKVIELTQFFCGSEWCWPVIGGALVYKDIGHLTSTYMETVGPYLKPYFDAVLGIHD